MTKRKFKYAPLRYDKVFKGFFTDKRNEKFLKVLIRHYLLIDIADDDEIRFVNTEFKPLNIEDKMPRADILFKLKKASGEIINLEMQVQNKYNLIDRISYYNSKMFIEQLEEGQDYKDLCNTVNLVFVFHDVFDNERYINNIVDYHIESSTILRKDRKKCFVELGKYSRNKEKYKKDVLADLLLALEEDEFERLKKEGDFMASAVKELYGFTQKQIDSYWDDMYKKYEMDMSNERAVERELGRKEGIFYIAKNMLSEGVSKLDISKYTGLSIEEIESL